MNNDHTPRHLGAGSPIQRPGRSHWTRLLLVVASVLVLVASSCSSDTPVSVGSNDNDNTENTADAEGGEGGGESSEDGQGEGGAAADSDSSDTDSSGDDDNATDDNSSSNDDNSDDGSSNSGDAPPSGDFCDMAASFDNIDPFEDLDPFDDLEGAIDQVVDAFNRMADAAPAEIRGDIEVLRDAFNQFRSILEEADYDFFAIDEEDLEVLDEAALDEASDNIADYLMRECGIDINDDIDVDSGDLPDPGDLPPVENEEDAMVQGLMLAFDIDEDLARCLVQELGLTDPDNIDPSAFGDPTQEVCGVQLLDILTGNAS